MESASCSPKKANHKLTFHFLKKYFTFHVQSCQQNSPSARTTLSKLPWRVFCVGHLFFTEHCNNKYQNTMYTYNLFPFHAVPRQNSEYVTAFTQISDNTTKNTHDGTNMFTAHIQRMRESNVFTGVCLLTEERDGTSSLLVPGSFQGFPLVPGLFQRDGEGTPVVFDPRFFSGVQSPGPCPAKGGGTHVLARGTPPPPPPPPRQDRIPLARIVVPSL